MHLHISNPSPIRLATALSQDGPEAAVHLDGIGFRVASKNLFE